MIRVQHLTLHFGAQPILDDVNLFVGPRDRVALIGRNGAGKTSLMKILAGQLEPESGLVRFAPNTVAGYFSQDGTVQLDHTVRDELLTAFGELREVERQMREAEAAMADPADDDALADAIDRHAQLLEDFERLEGYTVEARIQEILAGLGFATDAADRLTDEFSGGWQMRLALARLLLERPDLLLLDEPTNHLDPDAQAWLVEYLRSYPGSYLVVSHDRAFLDQVVDRAVELEDAKLTVFNGNYSAAMAEKKRRRDAQQLAYERQQKYIARNQRMIERFKSKTTRARAAKARERMLSKLERLEPPKAESPKLHMIFAPGGNLPRQLLEARDLTFGYHEGPPVFENVSFRVEKGQRLALVGPNGAGKTTLLRLLLGQLTPWSGTIEKPEKTILGYYAQHQAETLDPNKLILDELTDLTGRGENAIRSILGRLQMGGDAPLKQIATLSGGERSRVALAGLILNPANLLLLDEPTNHLDVASKQVLAEALKSFPGAAIIVSHDRAFVGAVANQIGELRDGAFTLFDGDLSYYLEKKGESGDLTAWNEEEYEPAPLTPEQVAREAQIIALEEQLAEVDAELEALDPDEESDQVDELIVRQAELVARLAELNEQNELARDAGDEAEEEAE